MSMARKPLVIHMYPEEMTTIRVYLGWTQIVLADQLAVHFNTIKNWEAGRTKIPKAAADILRRVLLDNVL